MIDFTRPKSKERSGILEGKSQYLNDVILFLAGIATQEIKEDAMRGAILTEISRELKRDITVNAEYALEQALKVYDVYLQNGSDKIEACIVANSAFDAHYIQKGNDIITFYWIEYTDAEDSQCECGGRCGKEINH